jgi:hypothetical protein
MKAFAVHESVHGTFETSTDVRYAAAFGGNADIVQKSSGYSIATCCRSWGVYS